MNVPTAHKGFAQRKQPENVQTKQFFPDSGRSDVTAAAAAAVVAAADVTAAAAACCNSP